MVNKKNVKYVFSRLQKSEIGRLIENFSAFETALLAFLPLKAVNFGIMESGMKSD